MNLKVTPWHFEELIKKSYSLDLIYILKLIHSEFDISEMCKNSIKIANLHQTLIRKGLISETGNKITTIGMELLTFIESDGETKIVKRKPATSDFEKWWTTYPGTDTFTHKGKKFTGNRGLRQHKEECRLKFDKILLEGEYTAQDMIDALNLDVLQKKESSVKTGTNRLSYMQNSHTYLNQRSFEAFVELVKQGTQVEEAPKIAGGTDI